MSVRTFQADYRIQVHPCVGIPAFKMVVVPYDPTRDTLDGPGPDAPREGDIVIGVNGMRWQLFKDLVLSQPPAPPRWMAHLQVEGGLEWYPGYPALSTVGVPVSDPG